MPGHGQYDLTIDGLVRDLEPVRRLPHPLLRASGWLGLVAVAGVVLYLTGHGLLGMEDPRSARTTVWLQLAGSIGTAILAGIAATLISLPDRSILYALLPLPTLLLWLVASGVGCIGTVFAPGSWGGPAEALRCLGFLLAISLPLSAVLLLILRAARPLRPVATAAIGGLAVAAAAASLLGLVHSHDSALLDILTHAAVFALVIGANAALGGRLLGR